MVKSINDPTKEISTKDIINEFALISHSKTGKKKIQVLCKQYGVSLCPNKQVKIKYKSSGCQTNDFSV